MDESTLHRVKALATDGRAPSEVVTLGETMLCLSTDGQTAVADSSHLSLSIGGAESNTAIGLCRLGATVSWISAVGSDAAGDLVMRAMGLEGVDLSHVRRVDDHPTGLMIKDRRGEHDSSVTYYRARSAATTILPADVDACPIDSASVLHLTGINLALGPNPRHAVLHAMATAKARGVLVSFDPNHRPKLWDTATATRELRQVLPLVDHLLCNEAEAQLITGTKNSDDAICELSKSGPTTIIVKRGRDGAIAHLDGQRYEVAACPTERAVDTVGAGDAFNAGWIFGQLRHLPTLFALQLAAWVAAQVVQNPGDYEGFPSLAEYVRWHEALAETFGEPSMRNSRRPKCW